MSEILLGANQDSMWCFQAHFIAPLDCSEPRSVKTVPECPSKRSKVKCSEFWDSNILMTSLNLLTIELRLGNFYLFDFRANVVKKWLKNKIKNEISYYLLLWKCTTATNKKFSYTQRNNATNFDLFLKSEVFALWQKVPKIAAFDYPAVFLYLLALQRTVALGCCRW